MALVLGSQFAIPNPWIHSYVSLNNGALFVAHTIAVLFCAVPLTHLLLYGCCNIKGLNMIHAGTYNLCNWLDIQ